jgi:hypothetical protein
VPSVGPTMIAALYKGLSLPVGPRAGGSPSAMILPQSASKPNLVESALTLARAETTIP